jgi:hypothetical protein
MDQISKFLDSKNQEKILKNIIESASTKLIKGLPYLSMENYIKDVIQAS